MKRFLFIAIALLIAGCDEAPAPTAQNLTSKPSVDISTPDRALKSYWAMQQWFRSVEGERAVKQLTDLSKVATDDVYRYFHRHTMAAPTGAVYQGEILEVKKDSETRAVILARKRNVTPVPKGIEASKSDLKMRESGDVYRYVLVRESDGWKVGEVWTTPAFPTYQVKKIFDRVEDDHLVGTFTSP